MNTVFASVRSLFRTPGNHHRVYLVLALLLTALLLGGWVCTSELLRLKQQQAHLNRVGLSLADRISAAIQNSTLALYSLGELALSQNGRVHNLSDIVAQMQADSPAILNVAILPAGVVTQIEPYPLHREAIGHDMFGDAERRADAELARDSRKLTVTGPYELIQGGEGLIARHPLYQDEAFWGFVSIVYRFPDLLNSLVLRYQVHQDFLFQVRSQGNQIILGNTDTLPHPQVAIPIQLPNNTWTLHLARSPNTPWPLILKIIAASLALLVAAYIYHRILTAIATQRQLEATLASSGELSQRYSAHKRMLAQISHDLRAPMHHMLSEVKRIAQGNARLHVPVETIEHNVQYQLALIDQLLEYSARSERERSSHPTPGYLFSFLNNISRQARFLAKTHANQLHVELADDLPPVICTDFNQLQQVLINLLGNAGKYTRQGRIDFRVSRREASLPGTLRLHFSIEDTGIGMPSASNLKKPHNQGHGLGLMIVSDLLRLLQSQLVYQARPEGGSHFHFDLDLPLTTDMLPPAFIESHVRDWDGEGLNLLLVDPCRQARDELMALLMGYGANVQPCSNLHEAEGELKTGMYDLILTELELGDGTVWDLLQRVRHGSQPVPVLLYSAKPASTLDGGDTGLEAALLKPASTSQLLYQIQQLTCTPVGQDKATV